MLYEIQLALCDRASGIWEVFGFESWPQISYHEGFIFFPPLTPTKPMPR